MRCPGFSLRWLLLLRGAGSRYAGFGSCDGFPHERTQMLMNPSKLTGAEPTAGLSGGALILSMVLCCSSPLLPVGFQTSLQTPLSLAKQPLSSLVSFLGILPLTVLQCDGGVHSSDAKISLLSRRASVSHPSGASSWN